MSHFIISDERRHSKSIVQLIKLREVGVSSIGTLRSAKEIDYTTLFN